MSTKEASRRSPLHDEWAVKVKTRAGWHCEGCGLDSDTIREHGGQLEAAHILPHSEYPDRRYDVANGKALCTFRNRKHPNGLGNGYGCHNAMSGHWGHSYGTVPVPPAHDRWELVGLALLAVSALLFVIAFKAHSHQRAWFEGAIPVLAASAPLWWVKRRVLVASVLCGQVLWMLLLAANIFARHSSLRPWTFGSPSSFGGFLGLVVVLLVLWGACVILVHAALARCWLSRSLQALWHFLAGTFRKIHPSTQKKESV